MLQKILDRLVSNLGPIYRTKGLGESVAGPVVALLGCCRSALVGPVVNWPQGQGQPRLINTHGGGEGLVRTRRPKLKHKLRLELMLVQNWT